jgi:isocitrate lyase
MGCDLVIVARTDALSSVYLDNNIDSLDHPFILGCVDAKDPNKLLSFPQAGRVAIGQNFKGDQRERILNSWDQHCMSMSL